MTAPPFAPILEAARTRLGAAALEARLPQPRSAAELKAVPDDRYLSQMSLRIFRAGLKHSLVDAKWPAFEEVFDGFEPRRVRAMPDEAMEALLGDARLIRHWGKLKSVRDNAAAMIAVAEEHGSFGAWLADWPATEHRRAVGSAGQTLQPDGRQFRSDISAHGRQGHVHPDAIGDCRIEALGRGRGAAQKPQGPRRRPILLQCLGGGNRPAALPTEPDPRRLDRGLS